MFESPFIPTVPRNPIPHNQWGRWIVSMEARIEELLKRSDTVDEALRLLGNDDASNKVRVAYGQVSARLLMMRGNYNEVRYADSVDLLDDRPADVVAMDTGSEIKTAWRRAYIGAFPHVSFWNLRRIRTALDEVGAVFDRLSETTDHVASGVMDALRDDMDTLSDAIGDVAKNCTVDLADEGCEREYADMISLEVYAGDIPGNVDKIAAIVKRHQEHRARELHAADDATAFVNAVEATGHFVVAVNDGDALKVMWGYPEDHDQQPDVATFIELKEKFRSMSESEKAAIASAAQERAVFGKSQKPVTAEVTELPAEAA
jgi:hypothetical protein